MDRIELSSAIRQEMQGVMGEALETVVPEVLMADLATLEQRVQQVGRVILGGLIERVAAAHAPGLPRPARCPTCKGTLKRRERPRPLVGLVGDDTLHRAYYWCAACKHGAAPLDAALGLGPGDVSPGLARVVARVAVDATFTPAVEQVQEALGATLSDETARRLAERIGAAAEAQTQAARVCFICVKDLLRRRTQAGRRRTVLGRAGQAGWPHRRDRAGRRAAGGAAVAGRRDRRPSLRSHGRSAGGARTRHRRWSSACRRARSDP